MGRILLLLAIALYMGVPASLLTAMGIPYDSPGGSVLVKLHPGTWVLGLALLVLAGRNPVRGLARSLSAAPLLAVQLGCFVLLLAWTIFRHGPSGSAFVIESLVTIPMLLLAASLLDERERGRLLAAMLAVLAANAALGIGEALTGERLMPHTVAGGVEIPDQHFRATALLGHPLANALVTAPVAMLMLGLGRWVPAALLMAGLLAFGGRTAFAATAALAGLAGAAWLFGGVLARRFSYAAITGGLALGMLTAVALAGAVAASGLGVRIFSKPFWDDSAQVRVVSWQALEYMTAADMAFGMPPADIETIIFRLGLNYPLETIENFWLLMLMQFGTLGMVPFVLGLLAGAAHVWKRSATPGRLALLLFLAVASSNNSLAAKTPAAALVFAAVALHGSRDGRHVSKPPLFAVQHKG